MRTLPSIAVGSQAVLTSGGDLDSWGSNCQGSKAKNSGNGGELHFDGWRMKRLLAMKQKGMWSKCEFEWKADEQSETVDDDMEGGRGGESRPFIGKRPGSRNRAIPQTA